MKRITRRDVFFFFMGLVALIFLDIIFNWEEALQAMKDGWRDGYEAGYGAGKKP
jgi:hypothetical protein